MDTSIDIETIVKRTNARRIEAWGPVLGNNGNDEESAVIATEWANGEGWDISVGDKPILSVHYSEIELLDLVLSAIKTDQHTSTEQLDVMHGIGTE